MPSRTPQTSSDPIDRDEENILTGVVRPPSQAGGMVYRTDTGAFELEDSVGVFDPRSGVSAPTNLSNLQVLGSSSISGEDTHTSKDPVTNNTLSIATSQNEDVFAFITYTWSAATSKEDFNAQVTLDSTTVGSPHKEEAIGTIGKKKKEKTDQRILASRLIPISIFSAEENKIELQFFTNDSKYEVTIWESTIIVFKIL